MIYLKQKPQKNIHENKQTGFRLTIYCPRALVSASCGPLEGNWQLCCHSCVDMANHLDAKSSRNRTSSNTGYLMIESSRKTASHTIKVTQWKRLHSGKTIKGEKENRLYFYWSLCAWSVAYIVLNFTDIVCVVPFTVLFPNHRPYHKRKSLS